MIGKRVVDKISGFSGTATGVAVYLSGAEKVQITGRAHSNGTIPSQWVDKYSIEEVGEGPLRPPDHSEDKEPGQYL